MGIRRSRGAAAVETAIVFPLLVVLFFGILEFGLMFKSSHSISSSTRSGARIASAMPRTDGYQLIAADAVAASLRSSVPSGSIDLLTVFKADPVSGRPVGGGYETCSTSCWRFEWDAPNHQWRPIPGPTWDAADQAACGDLDNTDYIGVYVRGHYDFATGLFGASRQLEDVSVMRLEPLPLSTSCSP
jgi:hypothetical protein